MTDIPENTDQEQPVSNVPSSQPTHEEEFCEYENGCNNIINLQNCSIDYNTNKKLCSDHSEKCDSCKNIFSIKEMVPDPKINNSKLCNDCWNEEYAICPNCDRVIYVDDYYETNGRSAINLRNGACTYCATTCDICSRLIELDNAMMAEDNYYCYRCFIDNFFTCNICSDNYRNDYMNEVDNEQFCDDCFSENFNKCTDCDDIIYLKDSFIVDNQVYCKYCTKIQCPLCYKNFKAEDTVALDSSRTSRVCPECFDKNYIKCYKCNKVLRLNNDEIFTLENQEEEKLCEKCYSSVMEKNKLNPVYSKIEKNFNEFSYTKQDKFINQLFKFLPISIKDLKEKHPSLVNGLKDLISFSKGKDITKEIVNQFRSGLNQQNFPVTYGRWDSTMQRSRKDTEHPQLVMNILASNELLNNLKTIPGLYELFDNINTISQKSNHPYAKDQIGWARIEVDPDESFLLVDEIQSDHSNAAHKLKNEKSYQLDQVRDTLKAKYNWNNEQFNSTLNEYINLLKDFPNIANQAILKMARQNKFKKIFWHTYEGGKNLKRNDPPKALYEKIPKENFFLPSEEKPFKLEAPFLEREASATNQFYRLARKLYVKFLTKFSKN